MQATWTFHIVTLGCKINQYESQAIREAWQGLGGIEVALEDAPQIFLVNSCAITARGERDTRHALYRQQRLTNENKTCLRILTGCAAQLVENSLQTKQNKKQAEKYFDVLVPPKAKALLMQDPRKLQDFTEQSAVHIISQEIPPFSEKEGFFISGFHRARPVLKVQDGCSHGCTYCIVPLVRGKSQSRPPEQILEEAQRLLLAGHREIMLSGINLHQYGRDLTNKKNSTQQWDFWDLLLFLENSLAKQWSGKARLRISSLEPSQLNSKSLEIIEASTLLCPHLHLSLQHGSPKVLKRMGRGHYSLSKLKEHIQKLRMLFPKLGLGADILMGFAGEDDADVVQTLNFIEEINLCYAHVFPYSIRPNTAAASFGEQVPHELKLQRAAKVRSLVEKQKNEFLQTLLHEETLHVVFDTITEAKAEKFVKGVDAHYAPCKLLLTSNMTQEHLHGILPVSPLSVEEDGTLLVAVEQRKVPEQYEMLTK